MLSGIENLNSRGEAEIADGGGGRGGEITPSFTSLLPPQPSSACSISPHFSFHQPGEEGCMMTTTLMKGEEGEEEVSPLHLLLSRYSKEELASQVLELQSIFATMEQQQKEPKKEIRAKSVFKQVNTNNNNEEEEEEEGLGLMLGRGDRRLTQVMNSLSFTEEEVPVEAKTGMDMSTTMTSSRRRRSSDDGGGHEKSTSGISPVEDVFPSRLLQGRGSMGGDERRSGESRSSRRDGSSRCSPPHPQHHRCDPENNNQNDKSSTSWWNSHRSCDTGQGSARSTGSASTASSSGGCSPRYFCRADNNNNNNNNNHHHHHHNTTMTKPSGCTPHFDQNWHQSARYGGYQGEACSKKSAVRSLSSSLVGGAGMGEKEEEEKPTGISPTTTTTTSSSSFPSPSAVVDVSTARISTAAGAATNLQNSVHSLPTPPLTSSRYLKPYSPASAAVQEARHAAAAAVAGATTTSTLVMCSAADVKGKEEEEEEVQSLPTQRLSHCHQPHTSSPTSTSSTFSTVAAAPKPYALSLSVMVIDNGSVFVLPISSVIDKGGAKRKDEEVLQAEWLKQKRDADTPVVASRFLADSDFSDFFSTDDTSALPSHDSYASPYSDPPLQAAEGVVEVGKRSSSSPQPQQENIEIFPYSSSSSPALPTPEALRVLKSCTKNVNILEEDLARLQCFKDECLSWNGRRGGGAEQKKEKKKNEEEEQEERGEGGGNERDHHRRFLSYSRAREEEEGEEEEEEPSPKRPAYYSTTSVHEEYAVALRRRAGLPPHLWYAGNSNGQTASLMAGGGIEEEVDLCVPSSPSSRPHGSPLLTSLSPLAALRDISLDSDALISGNTLRAFYQRLRRSYSRYFHPSPSSLSSVSLSSSSSSSSSTFSSPSPSTTAAASCTPLFAMEHKGTEAPSFSRDRNHEKREEGNEVDGNGAQNIPCVSSHKCKAKQQEAPQPQAAATAEIPTSEKKKKKTEEKEKERERRRRQKQNRLDQAIRRHNQIAFRSSALTPVSSFASAIYYYIVKTFSLRNNCRHAPQDTEGFGRTILALCGDIQRILKSEPRHGFLSSPCYVFGDIHGNFRDLFYFMDNLISFQDLRYTPHKFMFLGDYVDRGDFSVEVVAYLFAMKVLAPEKLLLLRGNHEDTLVSGDVGGYGKTSFRAQCQSLFGVTLGEEVWGRVSQVFMYLPLSANIDHSIFCVHGGIPRWSGRDGEHKKEEEKVDLFAAKDPSRRRGHYSSKESNIKTSSATSSMQKEGNHHQNEVQGDHRLQDLMREDFPLMKSFFEVPENESKEHERLRRLGMDTCWADPAEDESILDEFGFGDNPRGPGVILFGSKAVDTFLERYRFQYLFRAHQEKADGLKLCKNARVFTIFSTSGYVGHRNGAGVVLVADGKIRLMIKNADPEYEEEEEEMEEEEEEEEEWERKGRRQRQGLHEGDGGSSYAANMSYYHPQVTYPINGGGSSSHSSRYMRGNSSYENETYPILNTHHDHHHDDLNNENEVMMEVEGERYPTRDVGRVVVGQEEECEDLYMRNEQYGSYGSSGSDGGEGGPREEEREDELCITHSHQHQRQGDNHDHNAGTSMTNSASFKNMGEILTGDTRKRSTTTTLSGAARSSSSSSLSETSQSGSPTGGVKSNLVKAGGGGREKERRSISSSSSACGGAEKKGSVQRFSIHQDPSLDVSRRRNRRTLV